MLPDIALTFDDGPTAPHTDAVLDELARCQVHATFFVKGDLVKAADGPRLVRRIVEGGHLLGNHSVTHQQSTDADLYRREVLETDALLKSQGVDTRWLRLPYGRQHRDPRTDVLVGLARSSIGWSVDSGDWATEATGQSVAASVLKNVEGHARSPAIVLFHDDRLITATAVQLVLDALLAKGARFVRLDEVPIEDLFGPHVIGDFRARPK